jgi:predicted metalloprotease with PDZ domain
VISNGSRIATNFGSSHNKSVQTFLDSNALKDTFFFFGPKVQVVTYNVRGVDITFSYVEGEANEAFIGDLRERYEFILGKFDEHRPSQLFVALIPTKEDHWGPFFQGTALPNGVAFHTSALDPELWNHEITHEIIHEWLPLRMGGVKLGSDYSERYVFTEGYTEYLAHKFNLEMGKETLPEFLEAINAAFVAKEFSDSRLLDDPYRMGLLHAFVTDLNLRLHGKDSLFRTLKSLVYLPSGSRHQELDAFDRLQEKLRMGGFSPRTLAEIDDVPISLNYSDLCIKPAVLQMYSYELGFDFDVQSDGTYLVKDVNVLSRAYRAGVRDGMTILERIGGDVDDMNSLATFRVSVSGAESALSFYPKSSSSKPVMQFLYDSSDAAIESCTDGFASFLAGDKH